MTQSLILASSSIFRRELLTHAGKISHEAALEKSAEAFEHYKLAQQAIEKEQSLKEIEADIKRLKNNYC